MENPEKAPNLMKDVTTSSWFGLRLAHGLQSHPAPSDASWLPHSRWVWHVRPLES